MDPTRVLLSFKKHVKEWKRTIDKYEIDDLSRKPGATSWSLGQVCMHVIVLHDIFYMHNVYLCLDQKEGASVQGEGKNLMGRMIFFMKSIPPMKVKMPESEYFDPPQADSIAQLNDEFDHLVKTMEAAAERLPQADLTFRSQHPLLGRLNAWEWYQGAEFHIRHHLLQARRIEKFLQSSPSR